MTQENANKMKLIGKLWKYTHIYKHHRQKEEVHPSVSNLFLGSSVFLIYSSVFSMFLIMNMFCFYKEEKIRNLGIKSAFSSTIKKIKNLGIKSNFSSKIWTNIWEAMTTVEMERMWLPVLGDHSGKKNHLFQQMVNSSCQ